ncbi:hypothetical protein CONLIGDRAFT_89249 [Coniochaeta ligniaria NRRL 30616]|uniref:Uncharacterized protein n=1 Tax=Coniochaeta ligniaria NRRL 30616 TaxID=1408157 RepID=A0A1J7J849_9PEZI|nr:hypothetical protein CONLIGDRAFT_89249 [Coniochaeta ligniaria NRRL 30616]
MKTIRKLLRKSNYIQIAMRIFGSRSHVGLGAVKSITLTTAVAMCGMLTSGFKVDHPNANRSLTGRRLAPAPELLPRQDGRPAPLVDLTAGINFLPSPCPR